MILVHRRVIVLRLFHLQLTEIVYCRFALSYIHPLSVDSAEMFDTCKHIHEKSVSE